MKFDDYKMLKFQRGGRVLEVTLNRPEKLNAVDELMHHGLAKVFTDASEDENSNIVVLPGQDGRCLRPATSTGCSE